MKKRILLILVVGVSFAPPVFASSDLSTYRPNLAYTGEQGEADTRGARCELSALVAKEDAAATAEKVTAGTAGAAK